jgi:hypothetical protein
MVRAGGLPLDAVLVRGGLSTPLSLAKTAAACQARTGAYGLTFWSWPGMSAEEIAMRVRTETLARGLNLLPHMRMRSVSAAELLKPSDAFSLAKTGEPGHYTLHLGIGLDAVTWVIADELLHSHAGTALRIVSAVLGPPADIPAKGGT